MPPGDTAHLKNIALEAEENVKRLRNHASLALWCGNNENLMSMYGWEWSKVYKQTKADSTFMWEVYNNLFNEMLPNIVKKYDFKTAYWSCSPSNYGYNNFKDRNSGDTHDWVIWFTKEPFRTYRWTHGRFTSEYGMQSFPEMKTIKSFSKKEDWKYDSPLMDFRQRSHMDYIAPGFNGNDMISYYIDLYYKKPKNFESFVYLSQVMQAEGLQAAIEAQRMKKPFNMGSLYWQINDCWPTMSWSTIDYYYRWKAGHYFVKKAFQETIVASYIEKDTLDVWAITDRIKTVHGILKLKVSEFNGNVIKNMEIPIMVGYSKSELVLRQPIRELIGENIRKNIYIELALVEGANILADKIQYIDEVKKLNLPKPQITSKVTKIGEGFEIQLTSNTLAKNVYLQTNLAEDGFFTDNYFDILPGNAIRVKYQGAIQLSEKEFQKSLKINTLIDSF